MAEGEVSALSTMKKTRAAVLALAALALAACAAPAEPGRMVPDLAAATEDGLPEDLRGRIAIGEVGGGEATEAWDVSKVGSEDLREALRLSLERHGLLSGEGSRQGYSLDVFLIELRQPRRGLSLSVHAFLRFTLTRVTDDRRLFDEVLEGSYTATTADSLVAIRRLKIANEGAVKRSIAALLARLSRLSATELEAGKGREEAL